MSETTAGDAPHYRAFLSYSHADKAWADWLHKTLESYAVPSRMVGHETTAGPIPKRLYPVFRDREELPSSADLDSQIESALRHSQFLIIVCSPRAAGSRWVNEEILTFKRMGRANRILALIVDGEPNVDDKSGDAARECFPPALKFAVGADGALTDERVEPIAADARPQGDGRDNARLKLIAGLLGVGFDVLRQRDAQARRRRLVRRLATAAAIVVLLIAAAVVLTMQWQASQQQRADALARLADAAANDKDFVRAGRLALAAIDGYDRPLIGFDPSRALVTLRRAAASASNPISLKGHSNTIVAIAYAPDSSTLTTASSDGTARTWNAATGAMLAILKGHTAGLTAVAYSPDGRLIATASEDHTARLWDAKTGAAVATLTGHGERVTCLAFSPDGKWLVTGSDDKTARLWRGDTGAAGATLSGHTDAVWWAVFSPDGKTIATGSKDKTVRLWDAATGAPLKTYEGAASTVDGGAFSPDGKTLYGQSQDGVLFAWDIATGKVVASMQSGNDDGTFFAESPDGATLAISGSAGTIRLWDGKTHKLLRTMFGAVDGAIDFLVFSQDSTRLLSTSNGGDARLWNVAMGVDIASAKFDGDQMVGGAISPDGQQFAYGSVGGLGGISPTRSISAGRLRTDTPQFEFTTDIIDLAYSADGRLLITGGADGSVRLWDGQSGLIGKQLQACNRPISHVVLSADGKRAASSCVSVATTLWDTESGKALAIVKDSGDGNPAFTPDGSQLAVPLDKGTIHMINAHDGSAFRDLPGRQNEGLVLTFAPDGKRLMVGARDEGIRVYDVAAGTLATTLKLPDEWTYTVAFSPDDKHFATAGSGPVHLWDATALTAIATEKGFEDRVNAIAFSPDSRTFAAVSDDGTSRVWSSDTGQEFAILRAHGKQEADLVYLKDSNRLATLSWDTTLKIWDIPSSTELFRFEVEHVKPTNPDDPNSGTLDQSEGHHIHDYDWATMIRMVPGQDRVLTSMPAGTARFWNIPAALTQPIADVAALLCGDLLRGDEAKLTNDDRRSYPGFTVKDEDVCHPPTLMQRVMGWVRL